MARVKKSGVNDKHKKILSQTKGYYGARSRTYRVAHQAYMKALQYAYRDRRAKKREFRALWIVRINAFLRQHGLSYSRFIHMLNIAEVKINRKMLAYLAVEDPATLTALVNEVQAQASNKG